MRAAPELAAGVASLPSTASAFAAVQAAWRFLNNDQCSLPALVEPLRDVGRSRANAPSAGFVLAVHDWCKLTYRHPKRKRDLAQITHPTDVGYELTTTLLVDAADGSPLAPVEMHLKTATGVHSTRDPQPEDEAHLEQVLPTMRASRSWGIDKRLVHVIDREADSIDHFRQWDADGHLFLVRGDDRRVKWEDKSCLLSEIRTTLRRKGKFRRLGDAEYQGSPAQVWGVETEVVLDRPAKKNVGGKKYSSPGRPLKLRFLVVQIRDAQGKRVLAEWMLLTNVPTDLASLAELACCYYWRWRIESFFKLLKGHGLQLEAWDQETGAAIARRLLVASMACVVVWQLQADRSPEANQLKDVLVRLSGRQTKRHRPHTAPALLAGLWVLLSMLALLEHYDLATLKRLAAKAIPYRDTG